MKREKNPESWTWCPYCASMYGFMNPRITLNKLGDLCLKCAVKHEQGKSIGEPRKETDSATPEEQQRDDS